MADAIQGSFLVVPKWVEPEPWGKAFGWSGGLHAALLILMLTASFGKKTEVLTTLTEITFMEKAAATAPEAPPARGESIREGSGGGLMGGAGKSIPGSSHPEMTNVIPYSSVKGTSDGAIVTGQAGSGPIVPATPDVGLLGKRQVRLMPLAGRTEGGSPAKPQGLMPLGGTGEGTGSAVALSKENLSDIQKRQPGMGVTLAKSGIAGGTGVRAGGGMPLPAGAGVKERKINYESLMANPNEKNDWGNSKGPFSMEGPLKYRKILKMNLPPYPRWAEEQGIETSVSYRLWVDPKGRVRENNLYLEKASGYSEIDSLARESLLKMIFVPLPPEVTQEDEWGVATFRFELKKGRK